MSCSGRGAAVGGEHPDAGAGVKAVVELILQESYADCDKYCGCKDRLNMRGCECARVA